MNPRLRSVGRVALKLTGGLLFLLSLLFAGVAVRSFWVQDLAQVVYQWYPTPDSYCARWLALRSLRGTLTFSVVRNDFDLTMPAGIAENGNDADWVDGFRKRNPGGFGGTYSTHLAAGNQMRVSMLRPSFDHEDHPGVVRHDEYWRLTLPSTYVVLALLSLPAVYVIRERRRRIRSRRNLCVQCGYDLRGTPDRCPECGRRVPAFHERDAGMKTVE